MNTGRKDDDWFFMPSLKAAGQEAILKWKTHPIGGEIRPELWGQIFDDKVAHKQAQDFDKSVRETHASWLMDTGMSEKKQSATRIKNASRAVQKMGYEFHVTDATVVRDANQTRATIQLRNTGVAPFYYDWKIVVAALDDNGTPIKQWPTDWKITSLLPDDAVRNWQLSLESSQIPNNAEYLAFRIVNPLATGLPLRFANTADRQQPNGWFRIAKISGAGVAEAE